MKKKERKDQKNKSFLSYIYTIDFFLQLADNRIGDNMYKIEKETNLNNNMMSALRIIIIRADGTLDVIFSSDDNSDKNAIVLDRTADISEIENFYNKIKDSVYPNKDLKDRHLFYIKPHIEKNFEAELQAKQINITDHTDDILVYYYLSQLGNVTFVNSSEHNNIIIIPNEGTTPEQRERLKDLETILDDSKTELTDSLYLDVFEADGKKYATLEMKESSIGNLKEVLDSYLSKRTNKK